MRIQTRGPKSTDTSIPFNRWLTGLGYTTESFVITAIQKGFPLRASTVNKWRQGTIPREFTVAMLKRKFSSIRF